MPLLVPTLVRLIKIINNLKGLSVIFKNRNEFMTFFQTSREVSVIYHFYKRM